MNGVRAKSSVCNSTVIVAPFSVVDSPCRWARERSPFQNEHRNAGALERSHDLDDDEITHRGRMGVLHGPRP